jgi:signal transduction histidine kinase
VPLQILKTKTGELNRIMESLVKASQIGAKATPLNGQVIDLRNVVEDAVVRARPRADLLHADISTKLAIGALPVNADREELGRVLDNLINNSLSYSAPPARLFIDVSRDSERALVRVKDDGVGIPEEQREQVFARFYRGANPAVAKVPGVGLGLYISRQLAEHHSGSLVLESSTPEDGTVFTLAIPLVGSAAAGAPEPAGD